MKRFLSLVQTKAIHLSSEKWRLLILLSLGAFLKSFAIIFWDIGATTLLITQRQLYAMGLDFIGAAALLSLAGCFLWPLDRRQSAGSVRWVLLCVLLATGTLCIADSYPRGVILHLLFILKYLFAFILTTCFWAVSRRFIREQFTSLKFSFLFCLDLLGFCLAGALTTLCPITPYALLIASLFSLLGLALVFKTIFSLAPLPLETFTCRTDGIRGISEQPLVMSVLLLSFCGTLARTLTEALLYQKLSQTGIMPTTVLGLVWTLFGALGLMMVVVLYHTRYIYTTLAGLMIFGSTVILAGITALGHHSGPLASCYLILLLGSHFYLGSFLRILPRVLSGGIGPRLKKKIMTLAAPLGFVLCGSICLNFRFPIPAYFLIATGILTVLATLCATFFYSRILLRMFKMCLWRKGPIMLSYPGLLNRLKYLLNQPNPDTVIYALRILQIANHPFYEQALKKALSHPRKEVRLFALDELKSVYLFDTYRSLFQDLMHHDPEQSVRNKALCNLILSDSSPKKYLSYLQDRFLRVGAAAGFLGHGPGWIESVFSVVEQLTQSKNARDNITALSLIGSCPYPDFVPLVTPLIRHSNRAVVRHALLAAGHLQSPQLLPRVLRALDDADLQEFALTSLTLYGKSAFPPIEKMILHPQTPDLRRKQLILFLGAIPSGEGKQILLRALTIDNQKLKKNVIQNILDSGVVWTHPEKNTILKQCLKHDIDRISWLLHLREVFMNAPTHESEEAFEFLLRSLQEDIDDTRELILYQLLLLKQNDMFTKAIRILLTDNYELYLPAIGMIQDLISNHLYQRLKSVLILPLSHRHKATLSGLSVPEAVSALEEILINPPICLNHWIRATALYALRRLGSPLGIPLAESALSDSNPVVLEAAIWTLVRLYPDKRTLHQKLLSLPTSRLFSLSLDKLLES